jgi:hypothetical protein
MTGLKFSCGVPRSIGEKAIGRARERRRGSGSIAMHRGAAHRSSALSTPGSRRQPLIPEFVFGPVAKDRRHRETQN